MNTKQLPLGIPGTEALAAQEERWSKIIANWKKVLQEGKEVVDMMDSNLDHTTWMEDPLTMPRPATPTRIL